MLPVPSNIGLFALCPSGPLDRFSSSVALGCLSCRPALEPFDLPLQVTIRRLGMNDLVAVGHLSDIMIQSDDMTIVDWGGDVHLIADGGIPVQTDALPRGREGRGMCVEDPALAPNGQTPITENMQRVAPHLDLFGHGEARPGAPPLEAREADVSALKELSKGLLQPFQGTTLDLQRTVPHLRAHLPALCQRPALIKVGTAFSGGAITADPFLQCRVIQLTLILQQGLQPSPDRPRLRQNTIDKLSVGSDMGHGGGF